MTTSSKISGGANVAASSGALRSFSATAVLAESEEVETVLLRLEPGRRDLAGDARSDRSMVGDAGVFHGSATGAHDVVMMLGELLDSS
jgi:hypothetical protein